MFRKYGTFYTLEQETDGRNQRLTFRHDLGDRWSTFMREAASEALRTTLGTVPHVEMSENSVVVRFDVPPGQPGELIALGRSRS